MAVVKTTTIHTFVGLAADSKPTAGVPAGSRFWETDTGKWFQYDGSAWTVEAVGIQGNVAHDATDAGNSVKGGAVAASDFSSITSVSIGDRVDNPATLKGAQFVSVFPTIGTIGDGEANTNLLRVIDQGDAERDYVVAAWGFGFAPDGSWDRFRTLGDTAGAGLGVLAIGARTPDSSEVIAFIGAIGATSASRATIITPNSGKKARILSIHILAFGLTTDPDAVQFYFGTGAAITTNASIVIGEYDVGTDGDGGERWADGEGPIGAADAVVSVRTETETETGLRFVVHYREE